MDIGREVEMLLKFLGVFVGTWENITCQGILSPVLAQLSFFLGKVYAHGPTARREESTILLIPWLLSECVNRTFWSWVNGVRPRPRLALSVEPSTLSTCQTPFRDKDRGDERVSFNAGKCEALWTSADSVGRNKNKRREDCSPCLTFYNKGVKGVRRGWKKEPRSFFHIRVQCTLAFSRYVSLISEYLTWAAVYLEIQELGCDIQENGMWLGSWSTELPRKSSPRPFWRGNPGRG